MKLQETVAPSTDFEKEWYVSKVEKYKCDKCGAKLEFPRFNHPAKLLDTKVGRFSEWSNAFTCLCIALGYEARLCVDMQWTDNAWTEVYLKKK